MSNHPSGSRLSAGMKFDETREKRMHGSITGDDKGSPRADHEGEEEGQTVLKTEAQRFEAQLCSFEELVNVENNPMPLVEAFERLRPLTTGTNFQWERNGALGYGYGGSLQFWFQLIIWYHNWDHPDIKTKTRTPICFLHQPGCVYIYQPVLPLVSLEVSARSTFRPMFDMDPRSFYTFKFAWRKYLDFGVSDYRTVIGEKLSQWTGRCKAVIEKPLNATYWLMLMVGSYYRETLVKRLVLRPFEEPFEHVPVISIDSLTALSSLLFASERQILYAGVDPTPSYLQWLRYIGEQYSYRRNPADRRRDQLTVFETNEFLDLSTIVVFYGRLQQKTKEKVPMAWIGNPDMVRSYIHKYCEDNLCVSELEQAVRLYTYSCSLGADASRGKNKHYCWNGLNVCEIGVPMPCTQSTFLSPFITTTPFALPCPVHGAKLRKDTRSASFSKTANIQQEDTPPGGSDDSMSESDTDSEFDIFSGVDGESEFNRASNKDSETCTCAQYCGHKEKHAHRHRDGKEKTANTTSATTAEKALACLGDYDIVHCFAAVLAGGLNLAKLVVRVHFSIDPEAYKNLPQSDMAKVGVWKDKVMPWYKDFLRGDAHSRSRLGVLLESVVRALLGDGYTSGYHTEVLDSLICPKDSLSDSSDSDDETGDEQKRTGDPKAPKGAGRFAERSPSIGGGGKALRLPGAPPGFGGGRPGQLRPQSNQSMHSAVSSKSRKTEAPKGAFEIGTSFGQGMEHSLALWTDLYESESLLDHKQHFENFTQWCHSAQLVPFLQRCYRRCGVAGLLPTQRGGAQRLPLVLPTMADFCYGHCYPLHSILEYFYGGMKTIVCSVDDPKQVEVEMKQLKLSPGQDRMNFQCWLKVQDLAGTGPSQVDSNVKQLHAHMKQLGQDWGSSRHGSTAGPGGVDQVAVNLKKSIAVALARSTSPSSENKNDAASPPRHMSRHGSSMITGGGGKSFAHPSVMKSRQGSTNYAAKLSVAAGSRRTSSSRTSRMGGAQGKQMASVLPTKKKLVRPGLFTAKDPFFWFLQHNFAMYTFPNPPRNLMTQVRAGQNLAIHYHDFLSRNNSPTRDVSEDMLSGKQPSVVQQEAPRRSRAASRLPSQSQASRVSRAASRSGSAAPSRGGSIGGDDRDDEFADDEFAEKPGDISLSELDLEATGAHLQLRTAQPQNPPPSICLCQPTELSSHVRERWELELKFVDDKKLILGDQGWWPGAAGYRFTHEVKTNDASLYVKLGTVPQAQLLYMYTAKRVHGRLAKGDKEGKAAHADEDKSDSEASDEEVDEKKPKELDEVLPGLPQLAKFQSGKKKTQHRKIAEYFLAKPNKGPTKPPTSEMMLPPLLDGLGMPGVVLGVCS